MDISIVFIIYFVPALFIFINWTGKSSGLIAGFGACLGRYLLLLALFSVVCLLFP
jgi:hypothetical protein